MLYCADCTKLLDEDVEVCPNCGAIDPDFHGEQKSKVDKVEEMEKIEKIDKIENSNSHGWKHFDVSIGDVDKIDIINETAYDRLKHINKQVGEQQIIQSVTIPDELIIPPLDDFTRETHSSQNSYNAPDVNARRETTRRDPVKPLHIPEERPSDGLYIGMMLLCIFVSLVGFIMAIYYLTQPKHFRTMGIIMLCVSIVCSIPSLFLWIALLAF